MISVIQTEGLSAYIRESKSTQRGIKEGTVRILMNIVRNAKLSCNQNPFKTFSYFRGTRFSKPCPYSLRARPKGSHLHFARAIKLRHRNAFCIKICRGWRRDSRLRSRYELALLRNLNVKYLPLRRASFANCCSFIDDFLFYYASRFEFRLKYLANSLSLTGIIGTGRTRRRRWWWW